MARRRNKATRKKKLRERRKAIYLLPNLFTTASLFMGFYSMVATLESRFVEAALAILASLVFDGLDGKVARATKTTSRFGVEYDSLADLVAFGVAPAVLMYRWALEPFDRFGWLAAFLFVACGALRLARFNVQVEEVGTKHFVGLPIPAAASMISTTVLMANEFGYAQPVSFWPLVALMFLLSFLMVSNIHYLSFKELGLAKLKSFNWLVALTLFFVLVAVQPQVMGFALLALYVLLGPLGARIVAHKRSESEETKPVGDRVTSA
ncbi:CDP-diacylglycerol--serine O-phosphatidyltransferase [Desulfocarbo indianensis]|nr:CDP-diacylglycerol--serine O-phosphatidyltransferase [Desulfocarbo indianensis]